MALIVIDLINRLISLLLLIVKTSGYFGIFIGMLVESTFFPFPSEAILIPSGALIAQGQMQFIPVFLAGLFGSLLGSTINYLLALYLGRTLVLFFVDKYGGFLFLNKESIKDTDRYFKKHGEITTFIGKLIPIVRELISLPAGFAKMDFGRFLLFTGLGSGLWNLILIIIGYFFGSSNFHPVLKIITAAILILSVIILVAYYSSRKRNKKIKNGDIF